MHFSDVDVKSRADYKKILQLDLSEKTLKQLQEKGYTLCQLNEEVANLFTADEADRKQNDHIKFFQYPTGFYNEEYVYVVEKSFF